MVEDLERDGRGLVTIIDPHVKNEKEYFLHSKLLEEGLFVRKEDGKEPYVAWCWPRWSVWIDFMNP